jgi:F-type H+-transporting ATPase subunit delta
MITFSRRKIATYIASELAAGKPADVLLTQAAAYLVQHKRTGQAELLARDIEAVLAREYGLVNAEVVSARELSGGIIESIKQFVANAEGAKQVEVSASVDPSLLGGVIIRTPRAELDTTVRKQLNALRS